MSRPNPGKLAAVLLILTIVSSLPVWVKGGLYVTNYEGDVLHLADIVLRMAAGERPHLDFLTPIGGLAFWPIVWALAVVDQLGRAFALGQAGFTIAALLPLWWAVSTRLPPITAYGFGAISVLILTSLSHGYDTAYIAVSMHYNRWAWVLAFAAILVAVLPNRRDEAPLADGVAIAGVMAALGLLKVTYLIAFAPALALILVLRGEIRVLAVALGTGAVMAAALTLILGPGFVLAYMGDILAVRAAPLRDAPGLDVAKLLVSPAYLAPTLILLGAGILLRSRGEAALGLSLVVLLPAFVFVTWQNFGNDPLWLLPVAAILAAAYDTDRRELAPAIVLAAMAVAVSVPMIVVHGGSGPRLLGLQAGRYTPMVPGRDALGDVHMPNLPAHLVRARTVLNDPGGAFAGYAEAIDRDPPRDFGGETITECQVLTGVKASAELLAGEVAEDGAVFVADILSSHWLFAGAPLPGAAPWNYGTLDGLDGARAILVPLCPISHRARGAVLDALEAAGVPVALERRHPAYLLFATGD